jgi:hypothetical protein
MGQQKLMADLDQMVNIWDETLTGTWGGLKDAAPDGEGR